MPEIADRLEHYPGERPIFDLYGVEDEIQRALERKVPLKSGGYLVVDPAEAMTTIDRASISVWLTPAMMVGIASGS